MTPYNDDEEDEGLLSGYPRGSVVSGSHEDVYAKYTKILGEDNPALPMISSYLARQPNREKLRPTGASKWQNISMGFAEGLGTYDVYSGKSDPMAGYNTTKALTDQPYLEARKDWADEAKQVDMMASLADKQHSNRIRSAQWDVSEELRRQRQASSEKKALAQAEETQRNHDMLNEDRDETRRLANEDRDSARKDRLNNQGVMQSLAKGNQDIAKSNLELRTDMFHHRQAEDERNMFKDVKDGRDDKEETARNQKTAYELERMKFADEAEIEEKLENEDDPKKKARLQKMLDVIRGK